MKKQMSPKARALREALEAAIIGRPADALMLSGGIDSSLLAALDRGVPTYTVGLEGHTLDVDHAGKLAEDLRLNWTPIVISPREAMTALKAIVRLTGCYDRGLLNDIPLYVGMSRAMQRGAKVIRTGDFADTLFAGYEYLWELDLRQYLTNLLPHLTLASQRLGAAMGVGMNYPYLDSRVVELALSFERHDNIQTLTDSGPGDFHVQVAETDPAHHHTWGKITLREAAQGLLPREVAWRIKTDLEYGSGMYRLEAELKALVSDQVALELLASGRQFWDRAHIGLYLMYRNAGHVPVGPTSADHYTCRWCGGGVIRGRHHCLTCGAYKADEDSSFKL